MSFLKDLAAKLGPVEAQLTPVQVAEILGLTVGSLANWRVQGKGPKFRKLGREIRYPVAEVQAWLDKHPIIQNTAQDGGPVE